MTHSSTTTPNSTLLPEAAVAARIIRNEVVSRKLLRWLATPSKSTRVSAPEQNAAVVKSIQEIIAPLLETASDWEAQQVENASQFLAALCQTVANHRASHEFSARLLAASFLPLYRSLATGNLSEGFEQTRHRFVETVSVIALSDELGPDFAELVGLSLEHDTSLHRTFADQMGLSLVGVSFLVRQHVHGFNEVAFEFENENAAQLWNFKGSDAEVPAKNCPKWATPELLWRLAGELLAKKSDIVLPREWIDTPVPWGSISEHWSRLSALLWNESHSPLPENKPSVGWQSSTQQSLAPCETAFATANKSNESDAPELAPVQSVPAVVPKVFIAEVMSHNDPAFVNIVNKQLAKCRSEARPAVLATIVVNPEEDRDRRELCGNRKTGIRPWQQKLVNQLADHPHISDPYAFITSDDELLVFLLDVERDETTALIRTGLESVIGGSCNEGGLSSPRASARYYVGLAAASSPNASTSAEKVIESACRCLSGASAQSKSSIKSIEVY